MSTLMIFAISFTVLVAVLLIPGFGAIPYHGKGKGYLRTVVRFSIAYFKCGLYCVWRLFLFVFSGGKKPAVFQYMASLNDRCVLLSVCVMAKDAEGDNTRWKGHASFLEALGFADSRYVLVRIFYIDPVNIAPVS